MSACGRRLLTFPRSAPRLEVSRQPKQEKNTAGKNTSGVLRRPPEESGGLQTVENGRQT